MDNIHRSSKIHVIPETDRNSKQHMDDPHDDRNFHFVRIQELNLVVSQLEISED
jgi:hypothetical protein